MESILKIVAFLLLLLQIVGARRLVTHSKVITLEDSITTKWIHLGNNVIYHTVKFSADNSSKIIHNVRLVEDIFGKSDQYNCTYELDKADYGDKPFAVMQRQAQPNRKVNMLTPVYKSGKLQWKVLISDLTNCTLKVHTIPYSAKSMSYEETLNSVFFANSELCNDNFCKVVLDSEMKLEQYPVSRMHKNFDEFLSVKPIKNENGDTIMYLVTQQDLDQYGTRRVSLFDKNGVKPLAQCGRGCGLSVLYSGHDGVVLHHFNDAKTSVHVERYSLAGYLRGIIFNFFIPRALSFEGLIHPADAGYEVILGEKTASGMNLRINRYNWKGEPVSRLLGLDGFEETSQPTGYKNGIQSYRNSQNQWCLIQRQKKSTIECRDANCFVLYEKCFKDDDFVVFY